MAQKLQIVFRTATVRKLNHKTMRVIQTIIFAILSPIILLILGIFLIAKRMMPPKEEVVPVKVYRTVSGRVVIRQNVAELRRR